MTQDYKERIIKYLTNNYSQDTESTTPFFVTNIKMETLQESFSNYFDTIQRYIQGKDGKGNDLNIGFIYGKKNNLGIIAIVDNKFNILQVIDEYNTGTKFNEWVYLNIDITNGNIYGIDIQSNKFRFILLNNFLVKTPAQQNYEVKLRNSYILELNQLAVSFVEKNPSSSFYAIIGNDNTGKPLVSTYKIEVGSQNELIDYPFSGYPSGTIETYNIEWTGENYYIKFCTTYNDSSGTHYEEYKLESGDEEITIAYNKPIYVNVIGSIVMTNDATYIVCNCSVSSSVKAVRIIKVTSDVIDLVYQEIVEFDNSYNGVLFKKNNLVYGLIYIATNMPAVSANTLYKIEMGLIDNNDDFLYTSTENLLAYDIIQFISFNTLRTFDVQINYNLLSYYLISSTTNKVLTSQQVYNENNWNYTDYQDYNSMIPNSGILYDEDGNVIFARNLYNKTLNGNSTMSTLEVPNMLLNDITISQQDLLGQTNGTLITNVDDIEKNIYEDLFINFNNTITMQDQNTEEYVFNLNGATRLNNSISNTADYTNATLNRIRINYSDNTSFVKSINPASRISQFVYKYEFNVYVTKLISNIQLISNDTNTVYQTIDGSEFELNKAYKISQNVEIQ